MTIFTVCFKYHDRPYYKDLLEVFRASVKIHMPDVNFISEEPDPPPYESDRIPGFLDNTYKLNLWMEFFKKTNDNIIFMDCDMLALRSGYHAFDYDFDVAYTTIRQPYKAILNGGVIMTKSTEAAYRFLQELISINSAMYQNIDFHEHWRITRGYAGMNQSAIGCVLETGINGAKTHKYCTSIWNALDRDLLDISEKTVFVHIKSKLRNMILNNERPAGEGKEIMKKWYEIKKVVDNGK